VTSTKVATALDKALEPTRTAPLNVLLQVNTSGEESKSGLSPLSPKSDDLDASEIVQLSKHIIKACPRLRLQGLMTIGSLSESLQSETEENHDFRRLKETRDVLQGLLEHEEGIWGDNGRLLLSMGMSSDFESAIRAGSDIVRVGTGIFGQRKIT
jgi:pyridoxal phosphate enzyme (YggS family)